MTSLEAEGYGFEGLREEMRTAEVRWQKEEGTKFVALQISPIIPSCRFSLPSYIYTPYRKVQRKTPFRSIVYDVRLNDLLLTWSVNR